MKTYRLNFIAGALPLVLALLAVGCSSGKPEADDRNAALLARLDSIEAEAMAQIAAVDSTYRADSILMVSLRPLMTTISIEGLDPYMVATKGYAADFANTTGVSARVTDNGEFYIVTSVNPAGGLKHVSLSALSGSEEVTTPEVGFDGDINFRYNDSEMITFSPAQSDTIGRFIADHRTSPVTLRFNGASGKSRSLKLSQTQIDNIATAYEYARSVNSVRSMIIEREHIDRRIELARQQRARYSSSSPASQQ